ncbi:KH domain-containing protein [Verrucomicrobiaceae bacterium N1E253]|uniref:KH domain-containing protein n=1 Tax=Oceaniferula marina TaxID=2748318 RepID=A0A851GFQ3_9BACT|nr:KH domain-containing protein [Oceaniferula marina]NWK54105.1 KH domain-containing protein [Oceaniferula marina]
MNDLVAAGKILSAMLEKLGFEVELETSENEDGPCLNMISEDSSYLIGKHGDRLEDLQYLMNRILVKHYPDSPRVRVDCDHYRANQEKQLRETAIQTASQVIEDGKARKLKPLNAYYRRLAYNAIMQVEGVKATSPNGRSRYKRISIEKVGATDS